jgi:hypothetical protein
MQAAGEHRQLPKPCRTLAGDFRQVPKTCRRGAGDFPNDLTFCRSMGFFKRILFANVVFILFCLTLTGLRAPSGLVLYYLFTITFPVKTSPL